MKQKIIFLDIDGVLATEFKEVESDNRCKFESHLVENLNYIIEQTGAQIVISSTWRLGLTLTELRKIFVIRGFKYPKKLIGTTPKLRTENCIYRGNEIEGWIQTNMNYEERDNHNFCIIDDDSDMMLWHKDFFVKTDTQKGLTEDKVIEVIGILNTGEPDLAEYFREKLRK